MRMRNAAPLAAVAIVLTLVPAGLAGAGGPRFVIGAVDGRTAKRTTTFGYEFDITHGRVWGISGSFTCPGDPRSYGFAVYDIKQRIRFAWGRRVSGTVRASLGETEADPHPGSVTVTFTARVERTRSESKRSGRVRGSGTMRIRSARCDVGTTAWRGTGNYEPY